MMEAWSDAKVAIAKFMAPLFAWLAIGWAVYPYAAEYLTGIEDPTAQVDVAELRLFGIAAAITCASISLACAAYYFSRRKPDWHAHPPEGSAECAYCGAEVKPDAKDCPECARRLR